MNTENPIMQKITRASKIVEDFAAIVRGKLKAATEAIAAIKKTHSPGILHAAEKLTAARKDLADLLRENAAYFADPHPRTLKCGVLKVGFRKGAGKVTFDEADDVVARIEKHFPEKLDELAPMKRVPAKKALLKLSVADLKRLGCSLEGAGDHVVIEETDGDLDKLVARILDEAAA